MNRGKGKQYKGKGEKGKGHWGKRVRERNIEGIEGEEIEEEIY